jgi:hypothetical protein
MTVLRVISLTFYFTLITLTASSIGCLTTKGKSGTIAREQYSAKNWVKSEKYKQYVLANKKKKETVESQMASQDKEYLEDTCAGCHDLKRVFLRRSSRSSWENLLTKDYHLDMDLDSEEKSQLLEIFQKYLSRNKTSSVRRTTTPRPAL